MKHSTFSLTALLLAVALSASLVGCGEPIPEASSSSSAASAAQSATESTTGSTSASASESGSADADKSASTSTDTPAKSSSDKSAPEKSSSDKSTPAKDPGSTQNSAIDGSRYCVLIDPGHQRKGNSSKEPVGPNATQTKAKVSSGTTGRFSGLPEYQLNLTVSLLLKEELERRNFRVVMTRSTHDVDISNAERAKMAAEVGADIAVRIHANGSENPSVHGAMTICMTKNNPYCAKLYSASRLLSKCILDSIVSATGCARKSIWETDTMTGINWSTVPVTIVEMGYMTNQAEDLLLADSAYQKKMARGIADGIEAYFLASPDPVKIGQTTQSQAAKQPEATQPTETPKQPEATKPAEEPKQPEVTEPAEEPKQPEAAQPAETPKQPEAAKPAEEPKQPEEPEQAEQSAPPEQSKDESSSAGN